ncbi:MAG: tRNA pseudouridine(38-40) synthase TruA [Defluviitaleaceae bacterium]|nr:tRNA pseudouridine(38-40) synthase TruA [Defluviitaleaceae bacterium]
MKYLLSIAYKGTNYAGWQRQDNANTIQEEIEQALYKLYKEPITVMGASRTDAGVHALGQKCTFTVDKVTIPTDKLPYAINANLPKDISITNAKIVKPDFHPIFDAKNKTYVYKIYNHEFRNPLTGDISWHIYHKLDLDKMKKAAKFFAGEHDFAAFCAAGGSAKTSVRKINFAKVYEEDSSIISFEVNGNGFLYNMVRIMAGTLVYVGQGKTEAEDILKIIASKNRENAGITAPPEGLCLKEVYYLR